MQSERTGTSVIIVLVSMSDTSMQLLEVITLLALLLIINTLFIYNYVSLHVYFLLCVQITSCLMCSDECAYVTFNKTIT